MTFYLLVIPLLLLQLRTWFYLRKIHQNDQVLFQFCDFRRELMAFLRTDEAWQLSPESYAHFRMLLNTTNVTVHHFHRLRPAFNLRRAWRAMREITEQMSEQEVLELNRASTGHPQVEYFTHRMLGCWGKAFFTYTPFLRHQFLLQLLRQGALFLKKVGVRKWARLLEEARNMARQANAALSQQPSSATLSASV